MPSSKEIIKELEADGWILNRINGSHHIFVHREKKYSISIPHPKKDLKPGTVASIRKSAQITTR